eukprot:1798073-Rhodomonas_salina.1
MTHFLCVPTVRRRANTCGQHLLGGSERCNRGRAGGGVGLPLGDTAGEDRPTSLADQGRKGVGGVHRRVCEGSVQRAWRRNRGHDPGR